VTVQLKGGEQEWAEKLAALEAKHKSAFTALQVYSRFVCHLSTASHAAVHCIPVSACRSDMCHLAQPQENSSAEKEQLQKEVSQLRDLAEARLNSLEDAQVRQADLHRR
jgi:hypothetical protein